MNTLLAAAAVATVARPFWKSKTLLIAVALTVWGMAGWVRGPVAPPAETPGSTRREPGQHEASRPLLDATSPLSLRLGVSYLGGFIIGFLVRKSIALAAMTAGLIAAALTAAQHFGVVDLDWASLQGHVWQSVAWIKGEAGALAVFLKSYLPSGAIGVFGTYKGVRH